MAQTKIVLFFVVTLALTLCMEFPSTEGRYLKSEGNEVRSTTNVANLIVVSPPSPPPAEGRDVSDFRPTNPGHSPGVGHSVHN